MRSPRSSAAPLACKPTTSEEDVERLFGQARDALGSTDVCVAVGLQPSEDVPREPCRRVGRRRCANLTSTFLTARSFLREVARNGHACWSWSARPPPVRGGRPRGLRGGASAILGGLLLSLKNEIVRAAPRGRVNAVAPGWTSHR